MFLSDICRMDINSLFNPITEQSFEISWISKHWKFENRVGVEADIGSGVPGWSILVQAGHRSRKAENDELSDKGRFGNRRRKNRHFWPVFGPVQVDGKVETFHLFFDYLFAAWLDHLPRGSDTVEKVFKITRPVLGVQFLPHSAIWERGAFSSVFEDVGGVRRDYHSRLPAEFHFNHW